MIPITEWSSLHDQANLAMGARASMKQMDKVVDMVEDITQADSSAVTQGSPEGAPGTLEGQRRRQRGVVRGEQFEMVVGAAGRVV